MRFPLGPIRRACVLALPVSLICALAACQSDERESTAAVRTEPRQAGPVQKKSAFRDIGKRSASDLKLK